MYGYHAQGSASMLYQHVADWSRQALRHLERLRERVALHAAIPQLTQLRRSGRVSLSRSLLAGLLSIKPVLYIGQSAIEVVATVRGWSRAVERMVSLAQRRAQGQRVHLAVVHTNAAAEAHRLLAAIRDRFDCVSAVVAEAGPALAAHAGAGALGVATLDAEGPGRADDGSGQAQRVPGQA